MSERMTMAHLEERCANVNRRIADTGHAVMVQGRNGYVGLDEYSRDAAAAKYAPGSVPGRGIGWDCLRTITVGTKREVGEFLHAMMVGIDLSRTPVEFPELRP